MLSACAALLILHCAYSFYFVGALLPLAAASGAFVVECLCLLLFLRLQ